MRPRAISAIVCASALLSCQALFGVDDYVEAPDAGAQAGPGGAGGATASSSESSSGTGGVHAGGGGVGGVGGGCGGSGTGAAPGTCPGTGMIKVMFADLAPYCIDRKEVTRASYKAWLDSGCPVDQSPECAWNDSFEPVLGANDCELSLHALTVSPLKPVVCIDWCDARAYCKAQGKRLCGKRGGTMTPFASFADPDVSEWHSACTAQGLYAYPYGDVYQAGLCVGDDYDGVSGDGSSDDSIDVGTATDCKVDGTQLFDMSGNVWEWENSCMGTAGADDTCRHRGGSFWDPDYDLRCDAIGVRPRNQFNKNVGIRCCADVNP